MSTVGVTVSSVRKHEWSEDLLKFVEVGEIVDVSSDGYPVVVRSSVESDFVRVVGVVVTWTDQSSENDDV